MLEHRVALRLELVARLPLRQRVRFGHAIADGKKHHQVFARTAQIPIGPDDVGRLVVVVFSVVITDLFAVLRRLSDEIHAFVGIERRHTLLGEVEVIGSIVEAFFRLGVRPNGSSLLASRVARVVVEIGRTESDERQIPGPPVNVQPIQVDRGAVFASGYRGLML